MIPLKRFFDKKPPYFEVTFNSPVIKGFSYSGEENKKKVTIFLELPDFMVSLIWDTTQRWQISIDSKTHGNLNYTGKYFALSSEVKFIIDFMCNLAKREYKKEKIRRKLDIARKEVVIFRKLLPLIEKACKPSED